MKALHILIVSFIFCRSMTLSQEVQQTQQNDEDITTPLEALDSLIDREFESNDDILDVREMERILEGYGVTISEYGSFDNDI